MVHTSKQLGYSSILKKTHFHNMVHVFILVLQQFRNI